MTIVRRTGGITSLREVFHRFIYFRPSPHLVPNRQGLAPKIITTVMPQVAHLRSQIRQDARADFVYVIDEIEKRFRDESRGGLGRYFCDSVASAVVARLGDNMTHASSAGSGSVTSATATTRDSEEEVVRRALRSMAAKDADVR